MHCRRNSRPEQVHVAEQLAAAPALPCERIERGTSELMEAIGDRPCPRAGAFHIRLVTKGEKAMVNATQADDPGDLESKAAGSAPTRSRRPPDTFGVPQLAKGKRRPEVEQELRRWSERPGPASPRRDQRPRSATSGKLLPRPSARAHRLLRARECSRPSALARPAEYRSSGKGRQGQARSLVGLGIACDRVGVGESLEEELSTVFCVGRQKRYPCD